MKIKSLEIYYDVSDIPDAKGGTDLNAVLAFRNAAMDHIEQAVMDAGVGDWIGAEVGGNEVNFGFEVDDFDAAEAVIRASVQGTRFEAIREIERREVDAEEFEQTPGEFDDVQPMSRFEIFVALVFRRMPKRLRQFHK